MSTTSTHPYASGLSWLQRLFSGKPHQIIGGENGDPYMLRWYVIPRNPLLNIYVHKFLRSDDDRALHDHPWWFVSLILRGSYIEHTPGGARIRDAWSIAFRPAETRHRVQLLINMMTGRELPCWTVIVTGPKRRGWGFWCRDKVTALDHPFYDYGQQVERFVPWREWGDGGCGETS